MTLYCLFVGIISCCFSSCARRRRTINDWLWLVASANPYLFRAKAIILASKWLSQDIQHKPTQLALGFHRSIPIHPSIRSRVCLLKCIFNKLDGSLSLQLLFPIICYCCCCWPAGPKLKPEPDRVIWLSLISFSLFANPSFENEGTGEEWKSGRIEVSHIGSTGLDTPSWYICPLYSACKSIYHWLSRSLQLAKIQVFAISLIVNAEHGEREKEKWPNNHLYTYWRAFIYSTMKDEWMELGVGVGVADFGSPPCQQAASSPQDTFD